MYVNYGRKEDFEYLLEQHNMNFTGKIVIAKYGMGGRGGKVRPYFRNIQVDKLNYDLRK